MPYEEAHTVMTKDIAKLEQITRTLTHDIQKSSRLMVERMSKLEMSIALAQKEDEYLRAEIADYTADLANHREEFKDYGKRVSSLELLVAGLKGARWGIVGLVSVMWAAAVVAFRYFKG